MPRSYTKLTYHCTFSTKNRVASLYDAMRPRLHAHIARLTNEEFGFAREIGGTDDHVHILCDLRPTCAVASYMGKIKSRSTGWIHREFARLGDFHWQETYAGFTVSASVVPSVKAYIENQERHHKKMSFGQELRALLKKHGIEFEERYLF